MVHFEKELWVFNPEHDLVLGSNEPHYIPPKAIGKMAVDLALLPLWYASKGAEVLAESTLSVQSYMNSLALKPQATLAYSDHSLYAKVYPWGWNGFIKARLIREGVMEKVLPKTSELIKIREISGRKLAVEVLNELSPEWGRGEAVLLRTLEQAEAFVEGIEKTILKAPWSSSGKGLRFTTGLCDDLLSGWIKRTLKSQGYVVGEPLYNKVKDFAMEFESSNGAVRFVGYSIFETDSKGSYQRSLLASNEVLEALLLRYVSLDKLDALRIKLESLLTDRLANTYEGYLGVDMMVCQQDCSFWVHPCVEINLRMNMGVVARLFYDRYVLAGSSGYFAIRYETAQSSLLQQHEELEKRCSLKIVQERVSSGYLSLTPVCTSTHYQAYVEIVEESLRLE
ncbi:MAG: hypothetical protein ACRC3Z_08255 [Phocaeicola sp.]